MIGIRIVGAGPMGRLHARAVTEHPELRLVAVHDRHPDRARRLAAEFTPLDAPWDVTIVATPATSHVAVALDHLDQGWVLVEKPLGASLAEARQLDHPHCLASLTERYHPAIRHYRGPFRNVRSVRAAPASARGRDTDVVFDLMVHDIDLLVHWCGPVELVEATGSSDSAEARFAWEGGTATLVADRVASQPRRHLELDGEVIDLLAAHPGPDALSQQLDCLVAHVRGRSCMPTAKDALVSVALAERVRAEIRA